MHICVSFEVTFISGNVAHSVIFAIIYSSTEHLVRKTKEGEQHVRNRRVFRGSVEHFGEAAQFFVSIISVSLSMAMERRALL